MAHLVLLFLDLASLHVAKGGDDGLYQQAMADHHLKGQFWLQGNYLECSDRMKGNLPDALLRSFDRANARPSQHPDDHFSFSWVGWLGDEAFFQLTTDDAYSCLIYRRVGRSYRMVRETRFPDPPPHRAHR